MEKHAVLVEIVAKKKGCMLCDLALAILEEIAPEFEPGILSWQVVDMGDKDGLRRHEVLTRICGQRPAVPSIVINEQIAFDHIPDMEALSRAVQEAGKKGP
jgi:glutaredoxin